MLKNLFAVAVFSCLAVMALKLPIERENRQRTARARREEAREIQRWEDKGGNAAPAATSTVD
jgi:hypothetical protein